MDEITTKIRMALRDLWFYWPTILWSSFLGSVRWGLVTIIGYLTLFNIVAIIVSLIREGKVKWDAIFPPYFAVSIPWVIGFIFALTVMLMVSREQRKLISKIEPLRYVFVHPYNPPPYILNGVGIEIENDNFEFSIFVTAKIMGIQCLRDYVYKSDKKTDLKDIPELVGSRNGSTYGTENILSYKKQILEIVNWDKDGKLIWKVRPQDDSKLLKEIKPDTNYVIHFRIYAGEDNSYIFGPYKKYSISMIYKKGRLVVNKFKGQCPEF